MEPASPTFRTFLREPKDVDLLLACGFGLTPYPLDFRSQARIDADAKNGEIPVIVSVKKVGSDGSVVP
jgi:hypothetical protein